MKKYGEMFNMLEGKICIECLKVKSLEEKMKVGNPRPILEKTKLEGGVQGNHEV